MIDKFLKIILGALSFFVFINLLFLDFVWLKEKPKEVSQENVTIGSVPTVSEIETTTDCQKSCLDKIQEEVEKLGTKVGVQPETQATPTPTTAPRGANVQYLTIGSAGSTSNASWADISGTEFYFNLADYQNIKAVRWEINLRSFLAGNAVSARIYDVTNSRAVDGSELLTTSGTSVLLRSGDLTIWRGNNLYRVQAKSSSENPAYLDTPRLKILLE